HPLLPLSSTLFPYTPLFRSKGLRQAWREMGAFYNVHAGAKPARLMAQLFMRRSFYQLWKSSLYRAFVGGRRQKRARNGWFASDLDRKSTRLNSSHVSISYAV